MYRGKSLMLICELSYLNDWLKLKIFHIVLELSNCQHRLQRGTMFIAQNQVRMHDTDMAGLLYFARQFRFAHDALEDFFASEGYDFDRIFHREDFVFVIVHAEADYYASLKVGDKLEIHLSITHIGNTSFTIQYEIYRGSELIGSVKTVHVCLEAKTRTKIAIPDHIRAFFSRFLRA